MEADNDPGWFSLAIATASGMGLAWVVRPFLSLFGINNKNLWAHVGRLEERINNNHQEIDRLRENRHKQDSELFAAKLHISMLQEEVNDLCAASGKPAKYPGLIFQPTGAAGPITQLPKE